MEEGFEKISIREFARRLLVSDTTIRKAIYDSKVITNGVGYDDKGKPYIKYELAKAEWVANGGGMQKLQTGQGEAKSNYVLKKDKATTTESNTSKGINEPVVNGPTQADAKRHSSIYQAELLRMEVAEKKGTLVNKDKVYKQLFEVGQTLRSGLLGIPDRYIDAIFSATSRNEANTILTKAITNELEKLTTLDKIDFTTTT